MTVVQVDAVNSQPLQARIACLFDVLWIAPYARDAPGARIRRELRGEEDVVALSGAFELLAD
jgi:hypothetical protein